ncbi:MAG: apolipoprotein N-acyltransferase, partial [Bacteroidota bacterium]
MKKMHLILLSVLFGSIMAASWPSRGIAFLALLGWVPILFIMDYINEHRERFKRFSVFFYVLPGFLIWNMLTTYWLYNSTPAGAFLAIGLNSILMALVVTIVHIASRSLYSRYQGYLLFVMLWISFEYVHLYWDISWPWLNLGNVFSANPEVVQWYEYTGIFGGTLYVLLTNILIYEILKQIAKRKINRVTWFNVSALLVLNAGLLIFSLTVYHHYQEEGEEREMVIVQPNVDPYIEQYSLPVSTVISTIMDLAEEKVTENTDFVVAPESAIQDAIWEGRMDQSSSLNFIESYLNKHPTISLVIGASTFSRIQDTTSLPLSARYHKSGFYYHAHNTALLLDTTDRKQIYHKSKLVAGVEQMPFKKVLQFLPLEQLALDLGGTIGTLGKSPERTVFYSADSSIRVGSAICYESVYGEFTSEFVKNGANALLIITNDGWWGNTAGHKQHLDFASLRAIETRKSIARSANTGISAFV